MKLKVAFNMRIVFLNFSSVYVLAYFFELINPCYREAADMIDQECFLKRNKMSSNIANFQ